jgi:hypothetical protein
VEVILSALLREVGLKPTATWCITDRADAARMNRSIPRADVVILQRALHCVRARASILLVIVHP